MTQSNRQKFQFSNASAQKAEAELNLAEAQQLLQKRALAHLRDPEPSSETTEAGQCFRNVTRILAGRSK